MAQAADLGKRWSPPTGTLGRVLVAVYGNKSMAIGVALVLIILALTLFPSAFTSHDPLAVDPANRLKPGFWASNGASDHWLGTDQVGRDMWARLVYSFRVSVPIGFAAVAIAMIIGLTVSLLSVTAGGLVETVLMRLTDVQMAFPGIVLIILLLSAFKANPVVLTLVFAFGLWPQFARLTRGYAVSVITTDYVLASRIMGGGTIHVILGHLVRNIVPQLVALFLIDVGAVIVGEGAVSFLGLGMPPPTPSFGLITSDGKTAMDLAPWVTIMPGMCIMFIVYTVNMLGDSAQRLIDPLMRR